MYTVNDFKTKKDLKEALASGIQVKVMEPFIGRLTDGPVSLEGPHYPAPHTWYAEATVRNGFVVKVR